MQSDAELTVNQAGVGPGQDPASELIAIVADMTSLIIHVQASARLIAATIERDSVDGNDSGEVIVLDDVTPCYAAARATLYACNAGLDAALQTMLGTLRRREGGTSACTHPRERKETARRPSPRHAPTARPCASWAWL